MPARGRRNISKNLWRFFEIALFFAVSVVGFNVLAKTSVSGKTKSREHSSREQLVERLSMTRVESLFLPATFTTGNMQSVATSRSGQHSREPAGPLHAMFFAARPAACIPIPAVISPPSPFHAHLQLPPNLLQQNRVLLN
ncbi:hypothetical protein INT08_00710 [Prosthecochloris sp. N3]|uniref:Uncharacterized protein n=1 Tax=Prosthecochloris ethylica TaxID=2743976 RepID=A0ABR9XPB0_9CHLB|nr:MULTISPECIES: hypothetical protein [Prosthecochloris]MBF0585792.1 hypothetical protein [Prosthecochloris ethylica]MBF0635702.1 hypothetical protein [Prosthecochloris ethylica]RNA65484.1 hypothetical protein CR163_009835 [Prosthecochloris sp. ZM_2]